MNTLKENKLYFSKIGMRFFLGSILIFIVQNAAILGFSKLYPDFYQRNAFLITMIPLYVIAFPILIFMLKQIPVQETSEKKKMTGKELICFFLISYAGMYLSNILGNILASVIGVIKGSAVTNGFANIATNNNLLLNFFIMVLCAPVFEELVFRKLLVDRTKQYGDLTAILLSGFMFGLFHGNLYQFCYAFVIGVVFAYIYTAYHDVKYCIILHMLLNFVGSVLGVIVLKVSGLAEIAACANDPNAIMEVITEHVGGIILFAVYFLLIIAMVIAGVALFFINKKKISLRTGQIEIPKGKGFQTIALNAGMVLYILLWLGLILYTTII